MITIINYGIGNLLSVRNMFKRIGVTAVLSYDKATIEEADKIVIPGVGFFDSCMQAFNRSGLRDLVEKKVMNDKVPVLGICVGAQMMTRSSEEGSESGLGWLNADTIRFRTDEFPSLKIPMIGWNHIKIHRSHDIWQNLELNARFYFAHSYHFSFDTAEFITASTTYGYEYPVAFQNANIFGTQFHPEKSHKYGMQFLENFSRI